MPSRRATVTQDQLKRYLKAWREADFPDPRVEIRPDGTVIILPVEDKSGDGKNDWD